jgi:citrate synthase
MFTVMFAIPRTVGWLAQWQEMLEDPEQKIARPRQIYTGQPKRAFLTMEERSSGLAIR